MNRSSAFLKERIMPNDLVLVAICVELVNGVKSTLLCF